MLNKMKECQKYTDLAGPEIYLNGGKFLIRGGEVNNSEGMIYIANGLN